VLVTVPFPTIIYQLRSEKDHQKADGPGVRSPAPPPGKCPAHHVRGIFIPLSIISAPRNVTPRPENLVEIAHVRTTE
jgi:hypothetical protein